MKRIANSLLLMALVSGTTGLFSTLAAGAEPGRRQPILQFFATSWKDIQRRLPEMVHAGYGALWLPPPEKAASGRVSVGYDPADRFDLGDRYQYGTVATQYGTTQDLIELINEAHRLGLEVYVDTLANHNANRIFAAVSQYPDLIPQDFHILDTIDQNNNEITDFNSFTFQNWNNDLLGLADIAQEDGNMVLPPGSPLPPGIGLNAAGKPSFVRHPFTPQYYPTGTPVQEDVRELLGRWGEWLGDTIGADGFRLDAVRHTPVPFFGGPSSFTSPADGLTYTVSTTGFVERLQSGVWRRAGRDAFTFGEDLSGFGIELGAYADTGMRLLDFPLRFNISNVYNSNGFGDIGGSFGNSPGVFGITFEWGGIDGDVGVTFIQSHDDSAPTSNNLASAHVLTRVGRPIVYFDGNNIPDGSDGFPKPGRTDALGELDGLTPLLVQIHNQFARGEMLERWRANDLFIFERRVDGQGILLVGLNDRGDRAEFGTQTATVQTSFPSGTVLIDYSGQMGPITVGATGQATVSVPTNNDPSNDPPNPCPPGVFANGDTCFENNGRGFVAYAPATPQPLAGVAPISLEQEGAAIAPQSFPTADGVFDDPQPGTTFQAPVVTASAVTLRIHTDSLGSTAFVRLDEDAPINDRTPLTGTPEGLYDGFVAADTDGAGEFSIADIDVSGLARGPHVFRALVRAPSSPGLPPLFNTFSQVFFFDPPNPNRILVDGLIPSDNYDPEPIVRQATDPASGQDGVNELNTLFVEADDHNLYIAISGNIDGAESGDSLNGVVVFIDTDFGKRTGLSDFDAINDDSGPAPRLLSNSRIEAPSGFGAEFAAASFRGHGLNNAPVSPFTPDFAATPPVGANAGVYKIDPGNAADLVELPGFIAFNPANIANGTPAAENTETGESGDGLEIAVRLDSLFPDFDGDGVPGNNNEDGGLPHDARLGFVAYITSTGETGEVPGAASTPGGRAAAVGFVGNQFLPSQAHLKTAPGEQPARLTHAAIVTAGRLRSH